MKAMMESWQVWALGAAVFAALTTVFGKVGVESIGSDYATVIRTVVILAFATAIAFATGQIEAPATISSRTWLYLVLSGLATGASWLCYYRALKLGSASLVAPVDKLSVVLVAIFAVLFLGEKLSAVGWLGVVLVGAGTVLIVL